MGIVTKHYSDKNEPKSIGITGATVGQIPKVKAVDSNGVPTEWEAIDGRSDWNQNNETASDYIKNRPFYTGVPVETVLVEESTVSFADDGGIYVARFLSTLADYCYRYMFNGCTSLTHEPELPATTLARGCYHYMFSGCTSLKLSETKTEEYTQ